MSDRATPAAGPIIRITMENEVRCLVSFAETLRSVSKTGAYIGQVCVAPLPAWPGYTDTVCVYASGF